MINKRTLVLELFMSFVGINSTILFRLLSRTIGEFLGVVSCLHIDVGVVNPEADDLEIDVLAVHFQRIRSRQFRVCRVTQ